MTDHIELESCWRHPWAIALLAFACGCGGGGGGSSSSDGASNGAVGGSGGTKGTGGGSGGAAGESSAEGGGNGGTSAGGTKGGGTSGGGSSAGGTNGGDAPFLPLYENGRRLRAISLGEAGSKSRRLMAWYDTELETECTFGRAEDGEIRCLPVRQSLGAGFLDAECTEPIYYDTLVVPCTDVPAYRGEEVDVDGCGGTRIVRMQRVSADQVYHEACSAEPIELVDGATVWRDAEVMPPETFVAASDRERVNSKGFGILERIGEDGSREVAAMVDGSHGACWPRELEGADWRCLPDRAYLDSDWWFADQACSDEPLAYGLKLSRCVEPVTMALSIDIETRGLPSLLALGEPVNGTVYNASEECSAQETDELLWTLYPIEGPFDATTLFELTETALGDGRVRTLHNTIDETPLTLVPANEGGPVFFDTESEAPCVAFRHEGGRLCLPKNYARVYELQYADPECSEPIAGLMSEPEVVVVVQRNHCVRDGFADELLEVYATEEAYTGTVYVEAGGDCVETDPSSIFEYYRVTPATDEYPELEEIIE